MIQSHLKFHSVTFNYDSSIEPVFLDISFNIGNGWTGIAGANGSGKSTLLKLSASLLEPVSGTVICPENSYYCPQRTDMPPDRISDFLISTDREANILKDQLKIENDYEKRWETLSHGERKRAQLGMALWLQPDLLAVDEPTNHLDTYGRGLVLNALRGYTGIGLLVSHDREMLDILCRQCIFTIPPGITIRHGGFTMTSEAINREKIASRKEYNSQKKALKKLNREISRRKQEAMQADHKRSKRNLDPKDHDGREKIDIARVSGKDGKAGRLQQQLAGRSDQLQDKLENMHNEKTYTLGIWLPAAISHRDYIAYLPAGSIPLGGDKYLYFPQLAIKPADHIAVTGINGSGKSTFIKYLISYLNVGREQITYIPQEIDAGSSKKILNDARKLERDKLGHLMNIVSRLNSRPERLLFSDEPSPGEIRKLLLGLGMLNNPNIIIMDEPTNHMDIPSIECLENALSDCPCALLLVSHDEYFLKKLTARRWNITGQGNETSFELKTGN